MLLRTPPTIFAKLPGMIAARAVLRLLTPHGTPPQSAFPLQSQRTRRPRQANALASTSAQRNRHGVSGPDGGTEPFAQDRAPAHRGGGLEEKREEKRDIHP